MSEEPFRLKDEPTEVSVSLLVHNLKVDSATRAVSPKNYAHRLRVIRQQTELLTLEVAGDADERGMKLAKRKRPPDHREEGGQG